MPTSLMSSLKMFTRDGGGSTPLRTEKQSPWAWPGPWYGSWPRITTFVSEKEVYFRALKMSCMSGYTT